jgi:hypothetical protein
MHSVGRATILASALALVNLLDFLKVINSIVCPSPFTNRYLRSEVAHEAQAASVWPSLFVKEKR